LYSYPVLFLPGIHPTGSSFWVGVTLDWDAHSGVDYYDFEADTVATFNSPAKKNATKAYINSNNSNTGADSLADVHAGLYNLCIDHNGIVSTKKFVVLHKG
jgi:hypothetical protein